jgi:uncharacterized protein
MSDTGGTLMKPTVATRRAFQLGVLAAAACLAVACTIPLPKPSADQTRYFLLTATGARPEAKATAGRRWIVGMRGVDVAAYLRTRSLAVRSQANEVEFLDFARWGEPLDEGIARVLAEDLSAAPAVSRVARPPFRSDDPRDLEVAVSVTACEGAKDGTVRFSADWRILRSAAAPVATGTYTASGLRWDGRDNAQLAARLSEAVGGLGREIADSLGKESAAN